MIFTDWIIDYDLCQTDPMHGCWIFYQVERVLFFLWKNVLPKLSKITDLPNVSIREKVGGNIDLPKVIKMDINFELLKVSKMTSFKIFISPVMEKLEHQIWTAGKHHWKSFTGYLPQEVVISLAYNHLTNLFISSYRGATVIKFEQ